MGLGLRDALPRVDSDGEGPVFLVVSFPLRVMSSLSATAGVVLAPMALWAAATASWHCSSVGDAPIPLKLRPFGVALSGGDIPGWSNSLMSRSFSRI